MKNLIKKYFMILCILSRLATAYPDEMGDLSARLLENISQADYVELNARQDLWQADNPNTPFIRNYQYELAPELAPEKATIATKTASNNISATRILILANRDLYNNPIAKGKIDRYVQDLKNAFHCKVILETVAGGTPADIKNVIRYYHYTTGGLNGAIFMGRVVPALFEVPNDYYWWKNGYGYAKWPCELYFMDLDGKWDDKDHNGIFDDHSKGNGDKSPEIFMGRIDTRTMGDYGDEVTLLSRYLDKIHNYWRGDLNLSQTGLLYIESDFVSSYTTDLSRVYGAGKMTTVLYPGTNKSDWLVNRCRSPFGFIQAWTHGTWENHELTGGMVTTDEAFNCAPQWLGFNLISCSAANWVAGNDSHFLCGGYIYNNSARALVIVSSSKTGGMLYWPAFYDSIAANNCIGQALADWFTEVIDNAASYNPEYDYILGWLYGMQIVGDPMIVFKHLPAPVIPTIPPGVLPGDVNRDGTVNIVDALMTAQFYIELNPHGFNQSGADVSCDGQITIIDALMISQYYVGVLKSLGC